MSQRLDVYLLPALARPQELAGACVVVIDVLRASTTIVHAVAAGAGQVLPTLKVETALQVRADRPDALLGGERGGEKIPGFDLGNSPTEYTPPTVGGKTIVFTTTNGTLAIEASREAARVLIGAFVNLSAVCRELAGQERVVLLCAGTGNEVTREDVLFAGAVLDQMAGSTAGRALSTNDQGLLAWDAWRALKADLAGGQPLVEALRASRGGRNLIEIGQERDIDIAVQIDKFDVVPEWDRASGAIRAGS
jgi:2-phosphosulfolactate phosphatase